MSWLKDLGKSIIGSVAGGIVGGTTSNEVDARSVARNLEADKKLFEYQNSNKYQFMVNDLNKAGLNPLLAVGGLQGSSGGSVSGSSSNIDTSGVNNATAARAQIRIAEKNADTERLVAMAEVKEKENNARYLDALAKDVSLMSPINAAKASSEINLLNAQADNTLNQIEFMRQELAIKKDLSEYEKNHLKSMVFELNARAGREIYDIKKLDKELYGTEARYKDESLKSIGGEIIYKLGYHARNLAQAVNGAGVRIGSNTGLKF